MLGELLAAGGVFTTIEEHGLPRARAREHAVRTTGTLEHGTLGTVSGAAVATFSGAEEYRATFSHRFPGSLTLLCRTFCPSLVFISFPHGTDQSALLVSFRFKTFTTNYPAPEGVLSFLPRTAHAPGEARVQPRCITGTE